MSCVLGFITSMLMLFYYSMDPIDCDLLINEQARYFTYNYTQPQSIVQCSVFMNEIHEQKERENLQRWGVNQNKFLKTSYAMSNHGKPESGMSHSAFRYQEDESRMQLMESGNLYSGMRNRLEFEKNQHKQQVMRDDRERQIIGRHNSISLIQILMVPHVRSILACALFIYFKY